MSFRPALATAAVLGLVGLGLGLTARTSQSAGQARLLAWNDSGMHEMEASYDVYAVEPPGNNLRAQLVDATAHRVRPEAGGVTLTYQAVDDPSGSQNRTSIGKTDFWAEVEALFGASPAADHGLAGQAMPGPANRPQPMAPDPAHGGWKADGIPITRRDDAGRLNPYPMVRVMAYDAAETLLASVDVVLPVSDETSCRTCHGSNTVGAVRPEDGWVNDPDPERDYRLNVLRRHDDRHRGEAVYTAGLAASGYLASGLYDTVVTGHKPILCTKCHAGSSLASPGRADTSTLTRAMHYRHATVVDPATGRSLNTATDRAACYTCHAGVETQHLRGAMGHAVGADGKPSMQCQSCHGNMQALGSRDRKGWQDLPTCQSCHTGHALKHAGELRNISVFDASGTVRAAVDPIFSTSPNAPSPGLSLYSASTGHGGLACAACHGSPHAEYPSRGGNDNVQPVQIQGHGGSIADCGTCHAATTNYADRGPHNMHSTNQEWARRHADPARRNLDACRACHGADDRGTVLSRMLGDRRFQIEGQSMTLWQGYQVGCYNCHDGPLTERRGPNRPAAVQDDAWTTVTGVAVGADLRASDADGDALTLRIVRQPAHGAVALAGRRATYQPEPGFVGADVFTFAAWDGSTDSNLGTVRLDVRASNAPPTPTPTGPPATARPTDRPTDAATSPAGPTTPVPEEPSATPPRPGTPGGPAARVYLPWVRR